MAAAAAYWASPPGLGAVQKIQDGVGTGGGRGGRVRVGGVGGQVEQDVLLGALEVEVGLTRLLLPAAELLRQEAADIVGDIGIVVVGKAVIGALRIQKSGVGRGVLRQRRADAAVFGDDVPGGGEGIRPLAAKAGAARDASPTAFSSGTGVSYLNS